MNGSTHARLRDLLNGFQATQALHAAAALRLPDLIAQGCASSRELAACAGVEPAALDRLLGVLVALQVIAKDERARYRLASMGEQLRSDAPGSWHFWALLIGQPAIRAAWDQLVPAMRAGRNAFAHAHGTDIWTHRSRDPDAGRLFDEVMRCGTERLSAALAGRLRKLAWQHAVDVGGGEGTLLSSLLRHRPGGTGALLERPGPAARARILLAEEGLATRCRVVEGDFFRQVPAGGDLYILKFILHDWDDEAAASILHCCHRAAVAGHPQARLAVVERLLDAAQGSTEAALSDLNMLVNTGGRERTAQQYATLLGKSGFHIEQVECFAGSIALMVAAPIRC